MPNSSFSNRKSSKLKRILVWFFSISVIVTSGLGFLLTSNQPTDDLFIRLDEFAYFIEEGDSTLVTFEASPQLGSFNYVSYDSDVVQFIENRLIAVSPGNATIMVSSQSNPSVFQTVSVIVRPKDVEPQAPVEPEAPSEPEPEVPVDVEPELPEDPEPEVPVNPVDPDDSDNESVVTPPTIYTITITNETGAVITTLEVEEGSFITTSSLELPELFKGFYLEGETCSDDPFDLETPITEDLTLIEASFNDEAPCLQLDYIVLSGRPVAGSTLTVDIYPIGANVTISWYTSVNNRTYREIQGESSSTFTVRPEDSGKFIRVYVVSDSNPPVVRFDTIKLDVFGTVSETDNRIPLTQEEQASAAAIIAAGSIPIAYPEDLEAIGDSPEALSRSYVLIRDIDLSDYQTLDNSFINGTFSGNLSGQGFTISNLTISAPSSNEVGLFKNISGASIENLIIDSFNVTGDFATGSLIGKIIGGHNTVSSITITNSSISGDGAVGGLIGENDGDALTINNVTNYATVSSTGSRTGGILGRSVNEVIIIRVLNYGLITSSSGYTGGIVGRFDDNSIVTISEAGNFGTISAIGSDAGGLVAGIIGSNNQLTIENSFNLGTVEVTGNNTNAGGILGYSTDSNIITLSSIYSAGNVTTAGFRAGLIFGRFDNASTNLFTQAGIFSLNTLDVQVDGYTSGDNDDHPTSAYSTKIPVVNMVTKNTFDNATWDIETHPTNSGIWSIGFNGGYTYPYLTFQGSPNSLQQVELNQNDLQTISILEKINNEGFIPIASQADFDKIDVGGSHTFATGTPFAGTYTSGLGMNYILVSDVAFSTLYSTAIVNGAFTGTFDGSGFKLTNITIDGSAGTIGLFKELKGATVDDLKLDNFIISGTGTIVGALAGLSTGFTHLNDLQLNNISISGMQRVGGLIGRMITSGDRLTISNVSMEGAVAGSGNEVGGMIGEVGNTTLTMVSITTNLTVSGTDYVGGIIGNNQSMISINLNNIFTAGSTSGSSHVGGIFGWVHGSTKSLVINVISTSNVIGATNIGGIIGRIQNDDTEVILSNLTHSGIVTGSGLGIGGIIGIQANRSTLTGMNIIALSSDTGISDSDSDKQIGTIIGYLINIANINLTAVWDGTSNFNDYVGLGKNAEEDSDSDYYMIEQ